MSFCCQQFHQRDISSLNISHFISVTAQMIVYLTKNKINKYRCPKMNLDFSHDLHMVSFNLFVFPPFDIFRLSPLFLSCLFI